jgi:hypothetical protein
MECWGGKYESPLLEGGFRGAANGTRGNAICSSSSVVEASVGKVGLVIEAADDAGSTEGTLDLMDARDTRDLESSGHLGGETGETGLCSS